MTASSPATTSLPRSRSRPAGTSVYRPVTRTAVRNAIGSDGSAGPAQSPSVSTPSGRGRRSMSTARLLPSVTTNSAPKQTSRCRQRRQISSTASVAHHTASTPSEVESTPAARAVWVSQGVRMRSNALRTAWSTTSAATAACRTVPIATPATTTTPISSSQRLPEVCNCRGSGGGSPDGRRRRRTRVAVDDPGAGGGCSSRAAPASNGVEAVTTPPPAARRARRTGSPGAR